MTKTHENRKNAVQRLSSLLKERKAHLATVITEEMGKTLRDSTSEIEKCAESCLYFLELAEVALSPTPIPSSLPGKAWVERAPVGKVLALMPWNFPFWQVIRSAVPALLAGNSYHLKHSKIVPRCAEELARLFHDAGFSKDDYENIVIPESQIEAGVREWIARPDIRAVTFTGSTQVGRKIAVQCAEQLKKCVLELGGSDPWIVCESMREKIDDVVTTYLNTRIATNGQSCISPKRLLMHASVAEIFKTKLVEKMKAVKIGDPKDSSVQLGPLSSVSAVERLEELLKDAVQKGARIFYQGALPNTSTAQYFPLSAVENINEKMRLFHEEAFGPLISFYVYSNDAEAAHLANATEYGLGASVWTTSDAEKAYFRHHLQAGNIYFNSPVFSNAFLPFGGIKNSGWGKEMGIQGLREFTHEKTCYSV